MTIHERLEQLRAQNDGQWAINARWRFTMAPFSRAMQKVGQEMAGFIIRCRKAVMEYE